MNVSISSWYSSYVPNAVLSRKSSGPAPAEIRLPLLLVSGVRHPEDLHGLGEDLGPAAHSGFREGGENLRGEIPAAAGKERVQPVFSPTVLQEKQPDQLFKLDWESVDF